MQLPLQGAANCAGTNFTQGAASLALGYVQLGLQPAIVSSRCSVPAAQSSSTSNRSRCSVLAAHQQPCMGYGEDAVPTTPRRTY